MCSLLVFWVVLCRSSILRSSLCLGVRLAFCRKCCRGFCVRVSILCSCSCRRHGALRLFIVFLCYSLVPQKHLCASVRRLYLVFLLLPLKLSQIGFFGPNFRVFSVSVSVSSQFCFADSCNARLCKCCAFHRNS